MRANTSMLLSLASVLLAAACAGDSEPDSSATFVESGEVLTRVPASKTTLKSLGIATWVVLGGNDDGELAVVGVDRRGASKSRFNITHEETDTGVIIQGSLVGGNDLAVGAGDKVIANDFSSDEQFVLNWLKVDLSGLTLNARGTASCVTSSVAFAARVAGCAKETGACDGVRSEFCAVSRDCGDNSCDL